MDTKEFKERFKEYTLRTVLILVIGLIVFMLEMVGFIDLKCPIAKYTGLSCPACGATRLVNSFIHFELLQAFRYNPFIFISIPYYIYLWAMCGISYSKYGRIEDKYGNQLMYYIIIFILFGILRNIKVLTVLLPTKL